MVKSVVPSRITCQLLAKRANSIPLDHSHPLQEDFQFLSSGTCPQLPPTVMNTPSVPQPPKCRDESDSDTYLFSYLILVVLNCA